MFERLTNDDIGGALTEVIALLGVKEAIPCHDLVALLRKRETQDCVQRLATRFGMPITVDLSYVPKGFRSGQTDGFSSSALAQTDWTGRSVQGITAQVVIPEHLPVFGSSKLKGYPIRVRVSEGCHAYPDTFITIMAHELSHVLLASLCSPYKDSELHTDLVPIVLGFREVVRRGRRTADITTNGDTTTTRTTTYGYLTDAHFDFACDGVEGIIARHKQEKAARLARLGQVQNKLKRAQQGLAAYRDYFRHLDQHPPKKMRTEHAQRVVHLHAQDDSKEWESHLAVRLKRVRVR
jgi:hypothetical protein